MVHQRVGLGARRGQGEGAAQEGGHEARGDPQIEHVPGAQAVPAPRFLIYNSAGPLSES